ncbi:phosphoglyceromutase [Emticicia sp. 17c]|uniref:phosphoglyceromutase n=1 Tax=Emticicia sp. 17c TaxID=3127704 RepID=UPI00301D9CCC
MKRILLLLLLSGYAFAQNKTENVFIITTDGFRWQEVFGGIDSALLNKKEFVRGKDRLKKTFWSDTLEERRKKLLPFFWNTIASQGQLYGNRWVGNKVNVMNPYWFSYPGYNEILTGYADDKVNSNDKKLNENITVLEFLNQQKKLKGKVAAYSTWDVFPYIINEPRSGIPVNSGKELVQGKLTEKEEMLNEIQSNYTSLASDRHDFVTYYLAKEYVKKNKPNVFFLSFDETDEFAHEAKYDEYLFAAHTVDKFIADLWNYCQSTPEYKGKTTFIITTDHGRGDKNKAQWTSHGQRVADCYQIWFAVIGPDTPALGEVKTEGQLYQNQLAKTAASFLGYDFQNGKEIGKEVKSAKK